MEIDKQLEKILLDLIENKNVDRFYVGSQGEFDCLVKNKLIKLKKIYPKITFDVVLAYMPRKKDVYTNCDSFNTIYPEGLELVHPKYAISKRNLWMIENADYVITHVVRDGGAAKFKRIAEKRGLTVINIDKKFTEKTCN